MESSHVRYMYELATAVGTCGTVALGIHWEIWDTPQSSPLKKEESGYFPPKSGHHVAMAAPWGRVADTCGMRIGMFGMGGWPRDAGRTPADLLGVGDKQAVFPTHMWEMATGHSMEPQGLGARADLTSQSHL